MKIAELLASTARPALAARTTGPMMLRGPQVTFSPDEEGAEEIPEEFREQPGDREPDPEAAAEDEVAEQDADDEAHEEQDAEHEAAAEEETAAESEAEPDAEEGEEEPPKPAKNWKDRQIIKLRAKEKADAEERARILKENEELRAAAAEGGGTVLTAEDRQKIKDEVAADFRRQNYVESLNKAADAMFDAGLAAFPKTWEARIKDAGEVFADEIRAKPEFLEAVTSLDNAAAVYHELAGDPDEMERVLELPPHKMGMELAKLSVKLSAAPKPKPISKAPAPIKPLDKPGVQDRSLEDLANDPSPAAMREFDRRMAAEEKKRMEAR